MKWTLFLAIFVAFFVGFGEGHALTITLADVGVAAVGCRKADSGRRDLAGASARPWHAATERAGQARNRSRNRDNPQDAAEKQLD